jgi:hypothetical protein
MNRAHLEGATMSRAHLKSADLFKAHLEGADLSESHLEGVDLRLASLDAKTNLASVMLGEPRSMFARFLRRKPTYGNARLGDARWEGPPDLTQIRWESLKRLGDEERISWHSPAVSTHEPDHRTVVRAYRQVTTQLRAQGLSEEADRFAERAQIRRRKQTFRQMLEDWRRPWRIPGDLLRWLFSWFLAVLAGYGYHPGRSLFWYLATIFGFAFAYYQVTRGFVPFGLPSQSSIPALTWYEAGILSISSFHGRGFFQPVQSLGDPVAAFASVEAIIGLLIEISFIATFTQRFFGTK